MSKQIFKCNKNKELIAKLKYFVAFKLNSENKKLKRRNYPKKR